MNNPVRLLISFIVFLPIISKGQDAAIVYMETVVEDSCKLFLSRNFCLSDKACAEYTRYIRADENGDFYGSFEDRDMEDNLVAKGEYQAGKKQGHFEVYHSSGALWCRGMYANNEPTGKWQFFYDNGKPERVVEFSNDGNRLMEYYDSAGLKTVDRGEGYFKGYISLNDDFYYPPPITAWGKIVKGAPDSIWSSAFSDNKPYCEEVYKHGEMIKGEFPKGAPTTERKYRNHSYLNNFFLKSHLTKVDELKVVACEIRNQSQTVTANTLPRFQFDMKNFDSDLRKNINRAIENDIRRKNTSEYKDGDSEMVLEFTVDKDGRAQDFGLKAGMIRSIADAIEMAVRQQVFPANGGKMLFRLNLHFIPGGHYRYGYRFSAN